MFLIKCSPFGHVPYKIKLTPGELKSDPNLFFYRAFHRFGQGKFLDGGSILGWSQLTLLPQLSLKMTFDSKVVKIDS